MKMKKTKDASTSAGTPKKKKPENKGRLSSMLESMQKRSSPVNAHKVATKYFDDFKKDRSISSAKEESKDITAVTTPVTTAESNAINTAVSSTVTTAVGKKPGKSSPSKGQIKTSLPKILEDSHTPSESKVYLYMKEETGKKKSPQLRFGLKELKEKTGLSDKTIRNAIHSLQQKLSIQIVEPSLGIYGRKIHVYTPEEIAEKRKESGMVIDSITRKIIDGGTAVTSAVSSTVTTAVVNNKDYKEKVQALYKKYADKDWDDKAEKFYKSIKSIKPEILEAALILGVLKDGDKNKHIANFKSLIKDLGDAVPKAYLDNLREIWQKQQSKG
ncbi:MAG: hypothetical protein DHS20C13_23790 [Thermodesulfobacteriota bacterium]|nr:MAG: hypothetical protein DHS20C13_23790 [Thermodesulfobacteriota bacterium]